MLITANNALRYPGPVYILKWNRIALQYTPVLPNGTNASAKTV